MVSNEAARELLSIAEQCAQFVAAWANDHNKLGDDGEYHASRIGVRVLERLNAATDKMRQELRSKDND